jgi:threonine dehydrogenase-like Zn-dependent dehydrogenase
MARGSCDLVYELTGNPAALEVALALARYEGRVVIGSWYGNRRTPLDFGTRAHRNRNTLLFSQVSRIDSRLQGRFDKARRMEVACAWLSRLALENLVTHRFAFSEVGEAYRLVDEGSDRCQQVLLTY